MITFQSIQTALRDRDPYRSMDELIRSEIGSGQRVRAIIETLKPLVDSVLESPDLSPDGEEAFLGTLDALTGNCPGEQCYRDAPTIEGISAS